ncbi:unnamed protein product, partial [Prorocentrum cordatum]
EAAAAGAACAACAVGAAGASGAARAAGFAADAAAAAATVGLWSAVAAFAWVAKLAASAAAPLGAMLGLVPGGGLGAARNDFGDQKNTAGFWDHAGLQADSLSTAARPCWRPRATSCPISPSSCVAAWRHCRTRCASGALLGHRLLRSSCREAFQG